MDHTEPVALCVRLRKLARDVNCYEIKDLAEAITGCPAVFPGVYEKKRGEMRVGWRVPDPHRAGRCVTPAEDPRNRFAVELCPSNSEGVALVFPASLD